MNVMAQADKDALKVCRLQRQELRRLNKEAIRIRSTQPGMRGIKLDGMPKQRNKPVDQIADSVATLDEIDRRYMRELRLMVEKEDAARAVLDRMIPPPKMYAFLLQYYIDATDFDEAYKAAGISKRQGQRYKGMIE